VPDHLPGLPVGKPYEDTHIISFVVSDYYSPDVAPHGSANPQPYCGTNDAPNIRADLFSIIGAVILPSHSPTNGGAIHFPLYLTNGSPDSDSQRVALSLAFGYTHRRSIAHAVKESII
jgi:hypothetical protein